MDRLMTLAKSHSDQVELYFLEKSQNSIDFEDAELNDIKSTIQSGITMRIIKDHKLGFSYTKNFHNEKELVENAVDSLKGGVEARFDFPLNKTALTLNTYDSAIEQATNTRIVNECKRIYSFMPQKTNGQVNIGAVTATTKIRIMNSAGTDLLTKMSHYFITVSILYPGSEAGLFRSLAFKSFEKTDDQYLSDLAELYNKGERELEVTGGRMKVLFMPETLYALIWRLQSATNGESLYHQQSPLVDKLGEKIFDEQLTIIDNPLDDTKPHARAYDDEGIACKELSIVDKGVLNNFHYNLYYASKMNTEPTGHGFKTSRWPGDTISMKPSPVLRHLTIRPGGKEFWQLVQDIDRGIIVCGALGAHSGNIPNGDFSIGLAPGLYVEKGEITGRVKDAMISGNIYDVMQRVIDIENRVHAAYTGYYPAVLFGDVNVATKS
ncbi:PmbA [candidate division WOR_3 bacterium SM23_42]|uniref:PmbA n=1 Tax=candidate division WOR_3 bacterium SM23_42 TaxID=1703779 RepID=A0A0S8FT13_UNCW3|nr:MAG: PmbA [candidate division WOR_3 bacterium SM23_42]